MHFWLWAVVISFALLLVQEEFKQMIEDAGFHCVQYSNLTGGIVALHSGFKLWNALLTPGLKVQISKKTGSVFQAFLSVHQSVCRVLRHKFQSSSLQMSLLNDRSVGIFIDFETLKKMYLILISVKNATLKTKMSLYLWYRCELAVCGVSNWQVS